MITITIFGITTIVTNSILRLRENKIDKEQSINYTNNMEFKEIIKAEFFKPQYSNAWLIQIGLGLMVFGLLWPTFPFMLQGINLLSVGTLLFVVDVIASLALNKSTPNKDKPETF